MANDLISRKALLAEYDRVHIGPPGGARKLIEDAPAVDAVEVVHGRWVEVYEILWNLERSIVSGWECSVCGVWGYSEYNYCPNCGAKMDGERKAGCEIAEIVENCEDCGFCDKT